ncbi:hypothetical protein BSL82_04965 [Tardibacter chloracetimidivorans]|uniref:Uncharacterized protein n=1 Tax=Tardibacter chloracetimidivorans TaxID=1921510 RepID=A0A1L3ZSZ9_9SPHN|nr:hypothetical protein [Tardibacter chloracetimidivorans]API58745.1 hypothetical protein BSL82_04965 [Tardibacter chloracetimidivorans]
MSNDLQPIQTILGEIAQIEGEMGTQAYWKDEGKQARYRSLVSQKQSLGSVSGTILSDAAPVPIVSMKEFMAAGNDPAHYNYYFKMSAAAADVMMHLDRDEQLAFERSFEALPDEVAEAALLELMSAKPSVPWVSDEAAANFAKLPEGAILCHEWGHDARRNIAVARARLNRLRDRLDEHDDASFMAWFENLSDAAMCAILRKLVA